MNQPYSDRYTSYVLALIMLVMLFNTCDRTIISVLVDDIRVDMGFDDRQMGFIMGLAFSITYVLAGIPLARLADRSSRKRIVSLALFAWSTMTALTGMAQNFWQMVATRMGVGLGEAGGSPPCQSLVTDYVRPEQRARAMSLITIGALTGAGVGVVYGGWAAEHFGWRMALVYISLPGIVLAALFYFTVREPERRPQELAHTGPTDGNMLEALAQLARNRAFVFLVAAVALISITSMGRVFWEPTFMRRIYGMNAQEAGLIYFILGPLPSAVGALFFATLADKMGKVDRRWYALIPAWTTALLIPLSLAFYFTSPETIFLWLPLGYYFSFLASLVAAGWTPAIMALAQSIVPGNQRALSAATWSIISSLVGSGLGPLLVGDLNVRFEPWFGDGAMRYSLSVLYFAPLLALYCLYRLSTEIGLLAEPATDEN